MSFTKLALLFSLVAGALRFASAQTPSAPISEDLQKACDPNYKPSDNGNRFGGGGLMRFPVILCEHGIDTAEPSLIAALKKSDPEIQSLAANELAEKHDVLAIPAIEDALSAETSTRAKIGIAASLVSLDDPTGLKILNGMCADAALPIEDTVTVVQEISLFGKPTGICADVVLNAVERAREDYERSDLVTVFPSIYKSAPKDKADRMVLDAQHLLDNPDVTTRIRASQALAAMDSTASIDLIRRAIANENDPNIRAWHQLQLDSVLKPQPKDDSTASADTPKQ